MRRMVLLAGLSLVSTAGANAADYPFKAITIIVPFAPGGSNDIVARAIGQKLT